MDNNDDFEVLDVENYKGEKNQQFSHQALVMSVMNNCIKAGSNEMRSGYWNEKLDRLGNKALSYVPDTRKEFIESVKTAEMIMCCDLDEDAKNKIKKIKEKLKEEYKNLCDEEKKNWQGLHISVKKDRWNRGITFIENSLNVNLPYYQEYLEFAVDCYREIFAELTELTKRVGFYEEEVWEA